MNKSKMRVLLFLFYLSSTGVFYCEVFGQLVQFTWVDGNDFSSPPNLYGAKSLLQGNYPGPRMRSSSWRDFNGNLWLFGGWGYDINGNYEKMNDLWRFNPANETWTFVSGSKISDTQGQTGQKGIGSIFNSPNPRVSANTWADRSGRFWLFGGIGQGFYNDLWRYSVVDGTWTWVSGNIGNSVQGVYGKIGTPSADNIPGARYRSHTWLDASGNLWLFGGEGYDSSFRKEVKQGVLNDLWKYETSTGNWAWMGGSNAVNRPGTYGTLGEAISSNIPGARSGGCSWVDSSGNLWLFGGYGYDAKGKKGRLNDMWKYNVGSGNWTWVGGSDLINQKTLIDPAGTFAGKSIPGARSGATCWVDQSGDLLMFGGWGYDKAGAYERLNDVWIYSVAENVWAYLGGNDQSYKPGSYGTKTFGTATNVPGARSGASSWVDVNGRWWLFGGSGLDKNGTIGYLNDMWRMISQKANQTITFNSPGDVEESAGTFTLSGSSESGLRLDYSTSNPEKISISGNKATILAPGKVTIIAKQGGNNYYEPAKEVSQTICVLPKKPVVTVNGLGTESISLKSSASTGIQWFKDGKALENKSSPDLNTIGEGSYSVRVTVEGCSSDSENFILVVTGVSNDLKSGIELYPNPVGDELKILLKGTFAQLPAELAIYDQSARKILNKSVSGLEMSLRTDNLGPGTYLLTVAGQNRVVYKKFIKR